MPYTVFESTNMKSVHYAERIFDAVCAADVENGTIGTLGDLAGDVIYNFTKGAAEGARFLVVADNPPHNDEISARYAQRRDAYIIKAGEKFRARVIADREEMGYTIDGFTSATQSVVTGTANLVTTPVYVTVDGTTGKLAATTTLPEDVAFIGRVIRKRVLGGSAKADGTTTPMYIVQVLSVVGDAQA